MSVLLSRLFRTQSRNVVASATVSSHRCHHLLGEHGGGGRGGWAMMHDLFNYQNNMQFFYRIFSTSKMQVVAETSNSLVQTAGHDDHAGVMIGRSSIKPSKPYRTHKEQWMGETGHDWPTECCVEGCTNIASIGARIFRNGKTSCWVVPMCRSCSGQPDNHVEMIQRSSMVENSSFQHPLKLKAGTICLQVESINICSQLDRESRPGWKEYYKLLLAYKNKFHHLHIPSRYVTPNGIKLGSWVNVNQRPELKPFINKKGKVKVGTDKAIQRRICQLNDIGFVWDVRHLIWEQNFNLLLAYNAEHGHCLIPQTYVTPDGVKLGIWVMNERKRLKPFLDTDGKVKAGMDKSRGQQIERLNAVGFVWEIRSRRRHW